jgi:hypothetical protein
MRKIVLLALPALALTACKPTAEDIELALGARGMDAAPARCIGEGLEPLSEDNWTTIGTVAREFMTSERRIEDMTLGEVQGKLGALNDPELLGMLMRTGMGCMLMHGDLGFGTGQGRAGPGAPPPVDALPPVDDLPRPEVAFPPEDDVEI